MLERDPDKALGIKNLGSIIGFITSNAWGYTGEFGATPGALSQSTREQWEMIPGHRDWGGLPSPADLYFEFTGRKDFGRKGLGMSRYLAGGPASAANFTQISQRVPGDIVNGVPLIDRVTGADGVEYVHVQVYKDGVLYDAYYNDKALPGYALIVPVYGSATADPPVAPPSALPPSPTSFSGRTGSTPLVSSYDPLPPWITQRQSNLSESPISPILPPPAPDWTTQTEWRFPAADQRLIQPISSVDTGNRPLNFVVNKVLLPWRNALAFAVNIPLATLIGIDDAAKRSDQFRPTYEAAQVMLPLQGAMGLTMEIGPALDYAVTALATSQRLRTVARAPAFWSMGMGGVGSGIRAAPQGESLALKAGEELPTLGPQLKSALPPETTESAFANLIDNSEFSSHPGIIDRLSRARQFDAGGYKSLTTKGAYGRLGDGLDSDEALQNAFVRYLKGISRHDPLLADNPATALSPELHRQIGNLTSFEGRSAADVLRLHIDQMRGFTPDYVLVVLERESLKFIKLLGL